MPRTATKVFLSKIQNREDTKLASIFERINEIRDRKAAKRLELEESGLYSEAGIDDQLAQWQDEQLKPVRSELDTLVADREKHWKAQAEAHAPQPAEPLSDAKLSMYASAWQGMDRSERDAISRALHKPENKEWATFLATTDKRITRVPALTVDRATAITSTDYAALMEERVREREAHGLGQPYTPKHPLLQAESQISKLAEAQVAFDDLASDL